MSKYSLKLGFKILVLSILLPNLSAQDFQSSRELFKNLKVLINQQHDSLVPKQIEILNTLSVRNPKDDFLHFQLSHLYYRQAYFHSPIHENIEFSALIFKSLKHADYCKILVKKTTKKKFSKQYKQLLNLNISKKSLADSLETYSAKLDSLLTLSRIMLDVRRAAQSNYQNQLKLLTKLEVLFEDLFLHHLNNSSYLQQLLDTMVNYDQNIQNQIDQYLKITQKLSNKAIGLSPEFYMLGEWGNVYRDSISFEKDSIRITTFEPWLKRLQTETLVHIYTLEQNFSELNQILHRDFSTLITDPLAQPQITDLEERIDQFALYIAEHEEPYNLLLVPHLKYILNANRSLKLINKYLTTEITLSYKKHKLIIRDILQLLKLKDKYKAQILERIEDRKKFFKFILNDFNKIEKQFKPAAQKFKKHLNRQIISEHYRYYDFSKSNSTPQFKPYFTDVPQTHLNQRVTLDLKTLKDDTIFVIGYEQQAQKRPFWAWMNADSLVEIQYQKQKAAGFASTLFDGVKQDMLVVYQSQKSKKRPPQNSFWAINHKLKQVTLRMTVDVAEVLTFVKYNPVLQTYLCVGVDSFYVLDSAGQKLQTIDLPDFTKFIALIPKGDRYYLVLNQEQQTQILSLNIEEGSLKTVVERKSSFFIDVLGKGQEQWLLGYKMAPNIFNLKPEALFFYRD